MKAIRVPDELIERIDAARGDVPRERYVRRLLVRALDMSGEEKFRQQIARKAPAPTEPAKGPPPLSQTWRR